ncbi:BnaAnng18820D [Brassica napus]|uniref:BnaAnng18820D protein n=1 Tax=Brassica napus TaxID=3708 RepID=A0A078JDY3_BRANA|nr:BnaAnng18820D [Brassica napus]
MEAHVLPNLPQEIVCKIIELVGDESFYNLGPFLRAEKRGYALAHEPSVLKKCDVGEMEDGFVTCQIRQGCQFREFHLKCVSAGNRKAIYYEGLLTAPSIGLEETVDIFNVCLSNDKEASKVFQLFAAYHHDLRSDDTCEMGESIENQLKAFGAEDLNCNKYGESFKFPDDGVIKTPSKIPSMSTSSSSDGALYVDMLYAVNDSNLGIPDHCPCGSAIIIQISTEAAAIPKKYFVCKDFKNDGLHRKQEWTAAIKDETRRLKKTVDDHESRIRSLGRVEYRIDRIDEDAQKNDGENANLGYQIHEMEKVLKKNTEEIALLKEIIEKL